MILNVFILDVLNDRLIAAEILQAVNIKMPSKKDGWNFNWSKLLREKNTQTFVLRIKGHENQVEGVLQLKLENEMLIMNVIEIAPHNIGRQNKKFDHVAGCLISYACRESFKIDGNYKGYLTFVSKTDLIEWYSAKYGAEVALGQRMFISVEKASELIEEYINRKNIA